jgi:hypothetical protein
LRGRAEHILRATTKSARKQRHDCEGRRGREAYPIGRAAGGRCKRLFMCDRVRRHGLSLLWPNAANLKFPHIVPTSSTSNLGFQRANFWIEDH